MINEAHLNFPDSTVVIALLKLHLIDELVVYLG